jgi:hypothetical protein
MSLCPLAAQALSKPKDVSGHHPQESRFRRIMLVPKTCVPLPMHAFGPWRKSVEKAWIASKPLSDFLRFNLVAGSRCRLPRGIGQLVAMPTPPRSIRERMQLFNSPPAVTDQIKSASSKAPWDLLDAKDLVGQVNKSAAP